MARRVTGVLAMAVLSVWTALAVLPQPAAAKPSSCKSLATPATLGPVLLKLHRGYMRTQPDVHNPTITGPVGRVYYGICTTTHWALADFDARYNGYYFGETDQPERFKQVAGKSWVDLGNTGGPLCAAAPAPMLAAWKIKSAIGCAH
jgi:hypothetical protein